MAVRFIHKAKKSSLILNQQSSSRIHSKGLTSSKSKAGSIAIQSTMSLLSLCSKPGPVTRSKRKPTTGPKVNRKRNKNASGEIELSDWYLVPIGTKRWGISGILSSGSTNNKEYKDVMDIYIRVSDSELRTKFGVPITLAGGCDQKRMTDVVGKMHVAEFSEGVPSNWMQIVQAGKGDMFADKSSQQKGNKTKVTTTKRKSKRIKSKMTDNTTSETSFASLKQQFDAKSCVSPKTTSTHPKSPPQPPAAERLSAKSQVDVQMETYTSHNAVKTSNVPQNSKKCHEVEPRCEIPAQALSDGTEVSQSNSTANSDDGTHTHGGEEAQTTKLEKEMSQSAIPECRIPDKQSTKTKRIATKSNTKQQSTKKSVKRKKVSKTNNRKANPVESNDNAGKENKHPDVLLKGTSRKETNKMMNTVANNEPQGNEQVSSITSKTYKDFDFRTPVAPQGKSKSFLENSSTSHSTTTKSAASWSRKEMSLLEVAHAKVKPTTGFQFWKKVAELVPGRDSQECCTQWFARLDDSSPSGQTSKCKAVKKSPTKGKTTTRKTVSFRSMRPVVETAKFRKAVRAQWENHHKGYNDDLYDATPFKTKAGMDHGGDSSDEIEFSVETPKRLPDATMLTGSENSEKKHHEQDDVASLLMPRNRSEIDGYIAAGKKRLNQLQKANRRAKSVAVAVSTRARLANENTMEQAVVAMKKHERDVTEMVMDQGVGAALSPSGIVRLKVDEERYKANSSDEEEVFSSSDEEL